MSLSRSIWACTTSCCACSVCPSPSLSTRRLDEIGLAIGPSSVPRVEPASSQSPPAALCFPRCECIPPMLSPPSAAAELMRGFALLPVGLLPGRAGAPYDPPPYGGQAAVCAHSLVYSSCTSSFCLLQPRHVSLLKNDRILHAARCHSGTRCQDCTRRPWDFLS